MKAQVVSEPETTKAERVSWGSATVLGTGHWTSSGRWTSSAWSGPAGSF